MKLTSSTKLISAQDSLTKAMSSQKKWSMRLALQKGRVMTWMVGMMGDRKPAAHYPQTKLEAELRIHECGVAQWVTDGHVAVIGHGGQQGKLASAQKEVEVALSNASQVGDGPVTPQEAGYHLG